MLRLGGDITPGQRPMYGKFAVAIRDKLDTAQIEASGLQRNESLEDK